MYNRQNAVEYAKTWAFGRNPRYYDFDSLGGDCTNFVSQCIYAGCKVMNYTKDVGWYYNSLDDRSAAWTGVEFLHKFLVNNKGKGPYGREIELQEVSIGDILQFSFDGIRFSHTAIVTKIDNTIFEKRILSSSHTFDSLDRDIESYSYEKMRAIHIIGARG